MSHRRSLLAAVLLCGCNSDALVMQDGGAPTGGSGAPDLDIAVPEFADLGIPDFATAPKMMWIRQFGTVGDDWGLGVATDGMGNVYVTGSTEGGLDGNQNAGRSDAFLVKYDADGNKLWTRQFGGAGAEYANGVATDGAGNVYITGETTGGLDGNQNAGGSDAFLVKYDANGNKLWTSQFGTTADDRANGVAADGMGNVCVAGSTGGRLDGNQNAGYEGGFLVKYDTKGNKLWTRQFGDFGRGVASDGMANAYVAGSTGGHAFLVKYDADGNKLWTYQGSEDFASGVAADGAGNV